MFDGDKLIAKVPLSWEKSFNYGVKIPLKLKFCKKCCKNVLCDDCDKIVNEKRTFRRSKRN